MLRGQNGGSWASGCNAKGISDLHSIASFVDVVSGSHLQGGV